MQEQLQSWYDGIIKNREAIEPIANELTTFVTLADEADRLSTEKVTSLQSTIDAQTQQIQELKDKVWDMFTKSSATPPVVIPTPPVPEPQKKTFADFITVQGDK